MDTEDRRSRVWALQDFDFVLPAELIAQHPTPVRSASRLLDGTQTPPKDRLFTDFPGLLDARDLMILNDTRVMNARLYGRKPTGARVELLVERLLGGQEVAAHMRVSKKPAIGTVLSLDAAPGSDDAPKATVLGRWPDARGALFRLALCNARGDDPASLLARHGHVPLPPYITHPDTPEDAQRYQTVFARRLGAVAAPTAALHFDDHVLADLRARGVSLASVTLHVGAGTFQPVKVNDLRQHTMHSEWFEVPAATQQALIDCRRRGGRVVAVGTTCVRALESWALAQPEVLAGRSPITGNYSAETRIFMTPGFRFKVVDRLLTNFHLPKSTLLMLVSAFAGHARVMALYEHAIFRRYRFFSYGDAMLLDREGAPPYRDTMT
ncbi:MAG: tRNA preQ1(34) S-adenosylmethionine ribosyltransferase-isomerase QueA [Rhodoferax sp.]